MNSCTKFDDDDCSASEGHTLFCDNYGVAVTNRIAAFFSHTRACRSLKRTQELPSIFLVTEDQKRVRFHGPFNPFGFDEFLTSHLGPAPSQEKSEL